MIDIRRRLDSTIPLRLVSEIMVRLSRARLAGGHEGISPDELRAAAETSPESLERVALDYALRLGRSQYTLDVVAKRAGLEVGDVRRLWLSLGFAQPGDDDVVFTDGDLEALTELRRLLVTGGEEVADMVTFARLVGESFARIGEALVRVLQLHLGDVQGAVDTPDDHMAVRVASYAASPELGAIDDLLTYAWKRHLGEAIRRAALRGPDWAEEPHQCVGFVDISGFTRRAAESNHEQLAAVLETFQAAVYAVVIGQGSRVVKTVGDEIMFVADSPERGVFIASELSNGFRYDEEDIDVHVGIEWGPVLCRDGDYYGPTVNLASRLCDAAPRGRVLFGTGTRRALLDRTSSVDAEHSLLTPRGMGPTFAWMLGSGPDPG